ncbi:MAG: hypothetical protein J1F35_07795 [Erysipelotrichales bacterium]|nr:hypothetical protein [Erysipelotrichales bacterium]
MTKKETKRKNKNTKKDLVLEKIKNFFNDPKPIIILLIAIICFLLIFISKLNTRSTIYVGEINESEIQVPNIHYFTNNDMNYFYASNALFAGKFANKEVYSYQLGYFVVDGNGNYIEFASRSKEADTSAKLSDIVDELSGWSFAESNVNTYFFTRDVIDNLNNLHFIIKASTKKDSDEADINLDYKVDITKITK